MRQRLITLACALGALALFWAFFMPGPGRDEIYSRPTTVEHRQNGYLGAFTWLSQAGVPVVSWRRRFDALAADESLPLSGNLLVTTMPFRLGLRDRELEPLLDWLAQGNSLLVMASLGDTPDWAHGYDRALLYDLSRLAGFHVTNGKPKEEKPEEEGDAEEAEPESSESLVDLYRRLTTPRRIRAVPTGAHPIFDGVKVMVAESEYPAEEYWRALPTHAFALSLAHDEASGGQAFWLRHHGKGTILVSAFGSPFTNEIIGEGDNGRLLANIVAHAVRGKGAVLFDDTHQGLSELYDPEAFFRDPRLHTTLWLLLLFWLIWVLGATRLRPASVPPPAPRESALVAAVGGYLARVLRPPEAGRRLCALFFNDIHRRLGHPQDGSPPWAWLEHQSQVARADLALLREYHERLAAGQRVDLSRLQDLTVRLQEGLQ